MAHPLTVPARVEVAYIHKQIGREDMFDKLMTGDSGVFILVDDAKAYPEYRKRYWQIMGEEPPALEPEQE